jgi:ATP-dependent DNA helicase RecG
MSTKGGRRIPPTTKAVGSLRRLIVDGVMDRFRSMLAVRFEIRAREASLEGIQRQEIWEYPLEALREALVNALCHRDYIMSADIQIRVYDDQLCMWSPGVLPQTLTPEQLYEPQHQSVLRNPLIAQVFYYAGYIERWGSGTTRILSLCAAQGLPQPRFEEYSGGVAVTFYQDAYTPSLLQKRGLNERQIQAVLYVKEQGRITNAEYQSLTGAARSTLRRDMDGLIQENIFVREGKTGRGTYYRMQDG